jgi:hypothetical protein
MRYLITLLQLQKLGVVWHRKRRDDMDSDKGAYGFRKGQSLCTSGEPTRPNPAFTRTTASTEIWWHIKTPIRPLCLFVHFTCSISPEFLGSQNEKRTWISYFLSRHTNTSIHGDIACSLQPCQEFSRFCTPKAAPKLMSVQYRGCYKWGEDVRAWRSQSCVISMRPTSFIMERCVSSGMTFRRYFRLWSRFSSSKISIVLNVHSSSFPCSHST